MSLFDFKQLSELNKNLPDELTQQEEEQLTMLISDIEDRINKNENENVKNKSLINKFLSEFTLHIENVLKNIKKYRQLKIDLQSTN